jgi:hypothetical protein
VSRQDWLDVVAKKFILVVELNPHHPAPERHFNMNNFKGTTAENEM